MRGSAEEADLLRDGRLDQALQDDEAELDLEASLSGDDFIPSGGYKQTAGKILSQGGRVPASLFLLIASSLFKAARWACAQVGLGDGEAAAEARQAKLNRRPVIRGSLTDRHWIVDYVGHRPWLAAIFWTLGGALLGLTAAVVVNATLIEITINGFFAVYFGVLFLLIACLLLYNNIGAALAGFDTELQDDYDDDSGAASRGRYGVWLVRGFAVLLLLSSMLCFGTEQEWWAQEEWNWAQKIPLYALLGASTCFVMNIAAMDVVNLFLNVIRTESQLYLLAIASALAGFIFGAIFAVVDVEDAVGPIERQKALSMSEAFCYPIGLIIGALAGRVNQYLLD